MRSLSAILVLAVLPVSLAVAKVGGGDITFTMKGAAPAVFSHESHVAGGLACTACHPAPYVTTAQHKKTTMAMMQKGQSCGACHNGKKAFDVKGNCATCHKK
jgi:c(7)-type cytochrome triheme protein